VFIRTLAPTTRPPVPPSQTNTIRLFTPRQAPATSTHTPSPPLASPRLHLLTMPGQTSTVANTDHPEHPPSTQAQQMGLGHLPQHLQRRRSLDPLQANHQPAFPQHHRSFHHPGTSRQPGVNLHRGSQRAGPRPKTSAAHPLQRMGSGPPPRSEPSSRGPPVPVPGPPQPPASRATTSSSRLMRARCGAWSMRLCTPPSRPETQDALGEGYVNFC
jgi:hypothetical protein